MGGIFGKCCKKQRETDRLLDTDESYHLRCVVIGNDGTGKSSLIERYVTGKFKENAHELTQAVKYKEKANINIGNNILFELMIMDTPGNYLLLT